jgi:type IV secretory pathway TraG/TraD family ATPase VirD4
MKKELLEKIFNAPKNLIVAGETTGGKTTNIIFPLVEKMIDNQESILMLDPKKEYLNKYDSILDKKGYNKIIINLRDTNFSEGWNPLEYPYELYKKGCIDKAQEEIEKLGEIIFYEEGDNDPFWTDTAQSLFEGLVLALFEDGKESEINFVSINDMLEGLESKSLGIDLTTAYIKSKGTDSKPYILTTPTILAPRETKGGILSVARSKLKLYVARENLSLLMSKSTFKFDDILNKKTAIFIINKDESKSVSNIAYMFINQVYDYLLNNEHKYKFDFILDNFDTLNNFKSLSGMLGSSTARNIKIVLATRQYDELSKIYGNYTMKLCDKIEIGTDNIDIDLSGKEV